MKARVDHRQPRKTISHPHRKPKVVLRRIRNFPPLFSARAWAIGVMADLAPYETRLRGAALSGRWRGDSVLDLDVYADRLAPLAEHMLALGWRFDGNHHDDEDSPHPTFEVELVVPTVLHVLPEAALFRGARGATRDEVLYALRTDHARAWNQWCVPRSP